MIHLPAAFDLFGLGQVELQTEFAVPGSRLFFARDSVRLNLTQDSRERRDAGQRGSRQTLGNRTSPPTNPFRGRRRFTTRPRKRDASTASHRPQRFTIVIISGVYRSPATFIWPRRASVSFRSSAVNSTAKAPMLSSRYFNRFVPGIGIMSLP
jgi:hypothetical protein